MVDRTVTRNEDLTMPERAAMNVWTSGSADTTGMLCAVRAALRAHDTTEDARLAIAEKALRDVGEAILGVVENGSWATDPDPQIADRSRRYVADSCYAIATDAGLTEVAEVCRRALHGEASR